MKNQPLRCRLACFALLCVSGHFVAGAEALRIGWAEADITPHRPVPMRGGIASAGVLDPITATALAIEGDGGERVILISADLQHITDGNRYPANMLADVRKAVHAREPTIGIHDLIMMATHTHVAPLVHKDVGYCKFATERIVEAAVSAWRSRKASGISYGLGHAVVGHNRIAAYADGTSKMVGSLQKGSTADVGFSHIEGSEDHSLNVLATWSSSDKLTGLVLNIACPAQVLRGDKLSADYWHAARELLRTELGKDVFILPQISAAGDLATTVMVESRAEKRMRELTFPDLGSDRDRRVRQIAERIRDGVVKILPTLQSNGDDEASLRHAWKNVSLPLGFPRPGVGVPPGEPTNYSVELHAIRLGEMAMVTNPFEMYLDYGVQMKGQSPATQTFVIQLAGSGTYLPTARAVERGGYGAIERTCLVGPQAGSSLVRESINALKSLW